MAATPVATPLSPPGYTSTGTDIDIDKAMQPLVHRTDTTATQSDTDKDDDVTVQSTEPAQEERLCVQCGFATHWMVCKNARYAHCSFMLPYCVCCWPPALFSGHHYNGDSITHYRWRDMEQVWTEVTRADIADAILEQCALEGAHY
jgi:hypothetical protein